MFQPKGILFNPESEEGTTSTEQKTEEGTPSEDTTSEQAKEKTFTQSDIDAILKKRLAEVERRHSSELEKLKMDEIDRIKAEKQEVVEKHEKTETELKNTRLETLVLKFATKANIKADRLDLVFRMVDVSEITFDENLKPDAKQVESAINELVKTLPELVSNGRTQTGGTPVQGTSGEPLTREAIRNMSRDDLVKNREAITEFYSKQ